MLIQVLSSNYEIRYSDLKDARVKLKERYFGTLIIVLIISCKTFYSVNIFNSVLF